MESKDVKTKSLPLHVLAEPPIALLAAANTGRKSSDSTRPTCLDEWYRGAKRTGFGEGIWLGKGMTKDSP